MGRIFNSEMELDNFLLNNKISIKHGRLSDIVFDMDPSIGTVDSILEDAKIKAEKILGIKELKRLYGADYLTQELYNTIKNYLGVTTALSKEGIFRSETGNLFVPKWIEENYKKLLRDLWRTGQMSEEHLKLLKVSSPIVDNDVDFEKLFSLLKKTWERTALLGSANHKVFELFWINSLNNENWTPDKYLEELEKEFPGVLTLDQVKQALTFILAFRTTLMKDEKFKNAKFYPEYPVTIDTNIPIDPRDRTKGTHKLLGVVDLLVRDSNGKLHIFDYKLSSKDPETWSRAKERTHMYQLGFYKAAFLALGLDMSLSILGIIPLELEGFDGDTYNNLSYGVPFYRNKETDPELSPFGVISKNISRVVVIPEKSVEVSTNFIPTVEKLFKKIFPSYRFLKDMDDSVKESLRKNDIWYVKSVDKWRMRNYGGNGEPYIDYDSEEEAIKHLDEYHKLLLKVGNSVINFTISKIKLAISENNPDYLVNLSSKRVKGIDPLWFYNYIQRYCTIEWEVAEGLDEFEELGILVLHNIRGDYYNFIALDGQDLYAPVKLKKGEKITGNFVDDISPQQLGVDLLDSTVGNINNMKTMLAINAFPELFKRLTGKNASIGEILMLNPKDQRGCNASTELLRANFRLLCSYAKITNNFENGKIRCLSSVELARDTLLEFGAGDTNRGLNKIYSIYEHDPNIIANNLEALTRAKEMLEELYPNLATMKNININAPEVRVYIYIERAIHKLNGIVHVLELKDGNMVWLNILAPGAQSSKNLLNLSKTAKETIRLIKKDANEFAVAFRDKYEKFKKDKGYSLGRRLTANDEVTLFKEMFRDDPDLSGVFKFKNPWKDAMDPVDAEFLKWVLDTLYKYKNIGTPVSLDTLNSLHLDSESSFFDVPLLITRSLKKKMLSKQGRKGILTWIKEKIEWWKHPIKNIKRLDLGALTEEDTDKYYLDAERYRIFDVFSTSDDPDRRRILLKEKSISSYDQDIGDIMYEYVVAKLRKKHLDKYLPVLLAYRATTIWEANSNNVSQTENLKYISDFINSKILNVSLVPDKYKALAKGLSTLRNITTVSTLGFSTKSFFFQRMEGAFKDVSRSLIRPEGVSQFGWKEVAQAIKIVEGSTKDFGKMVFLCELLNEAYSLNDQDSNNTAKRLKQGALPSDFMGQMLWFTSIPDYYNRLTMFVALMIKDGCFDAHRVEGSKLIYDWKLDKRFEVFANAKGVVPTDPEKRKQFFFLKALYIKKMLELKDANYMIKDKNGVERPLKFNPLSNEPGDALPLAYTFNEANNLKSFSDRLYGYYNHEDLSLWKSRLLGASHMQFRAWWSSLRDRWFLKSGVYDRTNGHYELGTIPVEKLDALGNPLLDDNGNPIFEDKPAFVRYFVDENGEPTGYELTDENTEVPYIVWKGSYLEGMARTFIGGITSIFNGDGDTPLSLKCIKFVKGDWDPNANADVKRVRLTNMLLLAHDLLLWAIIGLGIGGLLASLLKKQRQADKNKKLGFGEMTIRNVENIMVSSLIASTLDLGALSDLWGPLADWTPPSFSVVGTMAKDGWKVITGEETFGRAVLSNISIARQTREYWWKATALNKD